eukprot:2851453-Rhodomonas_salina.1
MIAQRLARTRIGAESPSADAAFLSTGGGRRRSDNAAERMSLPKRSGREAQGCCSMRMRQSQISLRLACLAS